MIITILITTLLEAVVIILYCTWWRKPLKPILMTGVFANLLTQSILWAALYIFFRHYLTTLIVSETLIWVLEGSILHRITWNRLGPGEALLLSLAMNLFSFGTGLFLPV